MFKVDNNILEVSIPKKLSNNTFDDIGEFPNSFKYLIFNFEETRSASITGAALLISLAAFYTEYFKSENIYLQCEIDNIDNQLLNFLMNFGFFKEMNQKANLRIVNNVDLSFNKELIEIENRYINHQLNKIKSDKEQNNLIMPFNTIPIGNKEQFLNLIYGFRNKFVNYFEKSINDEGLNLKTTLLGTDLEALDDFLKAILEVIKNIFDHSYSWGIGAIHTKNGHIEVVFSDIGIGIANSMKENSEYVDFTEAKAIKHALIDGVSSKFYNGENKGRGFTIINEFVNKFNGYLLIKSGKYRIYKSELKEISRFPGTQVTIYI